MKLFSYLSVAVLLLSSIALAAYSPDLLSALIVGLMCIIALAGCIHGLLPTISITGGLLNGQKSIRKASETEGSSAWVAALQIERFFQQKTLDGLFEDYREKVQHQRETGQIVSDLDEVLNEDVLALHTWKGVIAQLPGTLTGLGILGTFVGLLLGLRGISHGGSRTGQRAVHSGRHQHGILHLYCRRDPVDPLQHHKQCPAHDHES